MPPDPNEDERPVKRAVFINCPFDAAYQPMFDAIVFTVHRCGFLARCAREDGDSDKVRIEKIVQMIAACELGIHDLSRIETEGQLPRFNMPFELGLFIGAQRYRPGGRRPLGGLILESEPYQHQRFLSDLAGNDFEAHHGNPEEAVSAVRKFLAGHSRMPVPGGRQILQDHEFFRKIMLPVLLESHQQDLESLTFCEFRDYVQEVVDRQIAERDSGRAPEGQT